MTSASFILLLDTSSPCNYDEGSPLVQSGVVIGVMSHNKGCLPPYVPTLYTRLSAHYDWFLRVAGLQPNKPTTSTTSSPATSTTDSTVTLTDDLPTEGPTGDTTTSTTPYIPTAPCVNCIPEILH